MVYTMKYWNTCTYRFPDFLYGSVKAWAWTILCLQDVLACNEYTLLWCSGSVQDEAVNPKPLKAKTVVAELLSALLESTVLSINWCGENVFGSKINVS